MTCAHLANDIMAELFRAEVSPLESICCNTLHFYLLTDCHPSLPSSAYVLLLEHCAMCRDSKKEESLCMHRTSIIPCTGNARQVQEMLHEKPRMTS